MTLKGTTICAVKKDGKIAVAGDGQVTMGESTIFKATAHKVRRIFGGKVVTGFAGTVSDAFALCDALKPSWNSFLAIWSAPPLSWRRNGAATRLCVSWKRC